MMAPYCRWLTLHPPPIGSVRETLRVERCQFNGVLPQRPRYVAISIAARKPDEYVHCLRLLLFFHFGLIIRLTGFSKLL
ncbi:hypothetical protein DVK05_05775 [Halorubrum sp. Atlit-8R]|nr:hypothetical protein DVK08_12800 [Halorubrum sp. Atlit-9R]RLM81572.1 hypothetical protein DVK05_05775 [Halorubrum sp. Atlit-8R]